MWRPRLKVAQNNARVTPSTTILPNAGTLHPAINTELIRAIMWGFILPLGFNPTFNYL